MFYYARLAEWASHSASSKYCIHTLSKRELREMTVFMQFTRRSLDSMGSLDSALARRPGVWVIPHLLRGEPKGTTYPEGSKQTPIEKPPQVQLSFDLYRPKGTLLVSTNTQRE